jgi:hypothetical protein
MSPALPGFVVLRHDLVRDRRDRVDLVDLAHTLPGAEDVLPSRLITIVPFS